MQTHLETVTLSSLIYVCKNNRTFIQTAYFLYIKLKAQSKNVRSVINSYWMYLSNNVVKLYIYSQIR